VIYFSDKLYKSGGKRQYDVRKTSADSPESFQTLIDVLQKHNGLWWGSWPTEVAPWSHADKRLPVVWTREELTPWLVETYGAVELPELYAQLMIFRLKKAFWEELYVCGAEEKTKAARYWKTKLLWVTGKLIGSAEWVKNPWNYIPKTRCDEEFLSQVLENINLWIEDFDRGHRLRVNQDKDRSTSTSDLPDFVKEYYLQPHEERGAWLAARPWLEDVMRNYV